MNEGWLFIFDNADVPDLLAAFLPQRGRGHVLITSRGNDFRGIEIIKPIEVQAFRPEEAREFLLRRATQPKKQTQEEQGLEIDEADSMAAELGNMPLALEHARAYISETQTSWKEYITKFKSLRPHF